MSTRWLLGLRRSFTGRLIAFALALSLGGCASSRKETREPAYAKDAPQAPSAPEASAPAAQHEPLDAPASSPKAETARMGVAPGSRVTQAASDLERSQRELDVAGGDCRNACRALGSMDRAAGHLCTLAQSDDERRRCEEAKEQVRSARVKVRKMCGTCPDVALERDAPIPSR